MEFKEKTYRIARLCARDKKNDNEEDKTNETILGTNNNNTYEEYILR
jgi:hypothetical protein